MNENNNNNLIKLPKEGQIYQGKVIKIESYGLFIEIDGFKVIGLVHISQISQTRIEKPEDVINLNEYVYVKVLSIEYNSSNNSSNNNKPKISLSMKYCDQTTGEDRDRHNIDLESANRKRKHQPIEQGPVKLEAIYNTICARCGGKGHIQSECYNTGSVKYELLPLEEESPSSTLIDNNSNFNQRNQNIDNRGRGRGRGREATLPAWMTSDKRLSDSSKGLEGGIILPPSSLSSSSSSRTGSYLNESNVNKKIENNQKYDTYSYNRDDHRFHNSSPENKRFHDNSCERINDQRYNHDYNHNHHNQDHHSRGRSREYLPSTRNENDLNERKQRKRSRSRSIVSNSSNDSNSSNSSSDSSKKSNNSLSSRSSEHEKKKSKKKHHSKKKSHKHKHHKSKHHKSSKKDSKKER